MSRLQRPLEALLSFFRRCARDVARCQPPSTDPSLRLVGHDVQQPGAPEASFSIRHLAFQPNTTQDLYPFLPASPFSLSPPFLKPHTQAISLSLSQLRNPHLHLSLRHSPYPNLLQPLPPPLRPRVLASPSPPRDPTPPPTRVAETVDCDKSGRVGGRGGNVGGDGEVEEDGVGLGGKGRVLGVSGEAQMKNEAGERTPPLQLENDSDDGEADSLWYPQEYGPSH